MNKKLHILFLCGWYPSKELPTNGDFIERHAKAVNLIHKVSILHIISSQEVQNSIIEETHNNNFHTYIGYVKQTNNPILKFIRFFKMYLKILKKIDSFDLVHLNILYPFGVFALHQKIVKRKPFVISEHWTGYHFPQAEKISFFEKSISKSISKRASFSCPVSSHLESSMLNLGLKGNYLPIPNVVDTQLFKPLHEKEKKFTIVHVSSLKNEHKNISGILKAAKIVETEIPNCTWNFIGGKEDPFTEEMIQLGLNATYINFIDHLTQEELTPYLQNAAVFVLFSNYENLPCVILESFACGIPVISTNVGGISEYFPENFGAFVPKNNSEELAATIKEIHDNPINKPEEMHRYAVENFSNETIAKQFSAIYYKALKITH